LETTSIIQIISIVNALGEIQRWGNTKYRPWFMSVIDGIISNSARGKDDASDDTDDEEG